MTTAGVREALAVLPTWRWSALYVAAYIAALLLHSLARVCGPLLAATCGYLLAGPAGAVIGILVGGATATGPLFSLIAMLLRDAAQRLGRAVNRAAATVADLAAETDEVHYTVYDPPSPVMERPLASATA